VILNPAFEKNDQLEFLFSNRRLTVKAFRAAYYRTGKGKLRFRLHFFDNFAQLVTALRLEIADQSRIDLLFGEDRALLR
jgi:hypothetical protein